jgi:hypothetical protein
MIKLLLLFFICLSVTDCETNSSEISIEKNTCSNGLDVVKEVSEIKGFLAFNTDMNKYIIYSGIDGDYDSQDVGVLCGDLPDEFLQGDVEVIFSGTYFIYPNEIDKDIPGQQYFFLDVSSIKMK